MARRTRPIQGIQRGFGFDLYGFYELDRMRRRGNYGRMHARLLHDARLCCDLYDALLEIDEILFHARLWVMDRTAEGPLVLDLAGNLHVISLTDIMRQRHAVGWSRTRMDDVIRPRHGRHFDGVPKDLRRGLPSQTDRGYWITRMRQVLLEWQNMSSNTPQLIADNIARAWKDFFAELKRLANPAYYAKRAASFLERRGRMPTRFELAGYPRYKRRRELSIPYRCYNPGKKSSVTGEKLCASGCQFYKDDRHENSFIVRLTGMDERIFARGKLPDIIEEWGAKRRSTKYPDGKWHGRKKHTAEVYEWGYANIRLNDGQWRISVGLDIESSRASHRPEGTELRPIEVRFDCVDYFWSVNGVPDTPKGLVVARELDHRRADMQSEFDRKWTRNRRYPDDEWRERRERRAELKKIRRLEARVVRIRDNTLHIETKRLAEQASTLTSIKPAIKENTQSGRGSANNHGAEVETVATQNRKVLSYAPAKAHGMLEYKAKELGVWCDPPEDHPDYVAPKMGAAREVSDASKAVRNAEGALRKQEGERSYGL